MPLPSTEDVDLGKGFTPWGTHRRLKPHETVNMIQEEVEMIDYLKASGPVGVWKLLNDLARKAGPHRYKVRALRHNLIPLSLRLISEKKLRRDRVRQLMMIHPEYRPTQPCLAENLPDLTPTNHDQQFSDQRRR